MGIESGTLPVDSIRATLGTRRIGRRIEYLQETTSTNDTAWQFADAPDADGLVVFAEFQSAGRGRFGRRWSSPRGASILCSVLVMDGQEAVPANQLGAIVPVAVRDAVIATTGVVPTIRWPNDLFVAQRKMAGILIEARIRSSGSRAFVVGIGINCLQQRPHLDPMPGPTATSLEIESQRPIDRTALAVALLKQLDGWLATPPSWDFGSLRDRWLAGARPLGCRATLRQAGKVFDGTVIDFDPRAGVTVQLDHGGMRIFEAAETTVLSWETATPGKDSGSYSDRFLERA